MRSRASVAESEPSPAATETSKPLRQYDVYRDALSIFSHSACTDPSIFFQSAFAWQVAIIVFFGFFYTVNITMLGQPILVVFVGPTLAAVVVARYYLTRLDDQGRAAKLWATVWLVFIHAVGVMGVVVDRFSDREKVEAKMQDLMGPKAGLVPPSLLAVGLINGSLGLSKYKAVWFWAMGGEALAWWIFHMGHYLPHEPGSVALSAFTSICSYLAGGLVAHLSEKTVLQSYDRESRRRAELRALESEKQQLVTEHTDVVKQLYTLHEASEHTAAAAPPRAAAVPAGSPG